MEVPSEVVEDFGAGGLLSAPFEAGATAAPGAVEGFNFQPHKESLRERTCNLCEIITKILENMLYDVELRGILYRNECRSMQCSISLAPNSCAG